MPLYSFGSRRQAPPPSAPKIAPGAEVRLAFAKDKFQGGRNIKFPMRRDGAGDYDSATDYELAAQKIAQILATRARTGAFPGELAGTPEVGSRLHQLHARILDETTRELARVLTREALQLWVPEVRVVSVKVVLIGIDTDAKKHGISISVQFRLSSQNSTGELAEVTLVPRA